MNKPLILATAGVAILAAGVAGAQTYSAYPGYRDGYDNGQARVVRCESTNSRRNFCRIDTRGGVQIYRQLSRQPCVQGRNWRATTDGIAVTDGCRAEFVVNTGYQSRYGTTQGNYRTDRYGRRVYDDRYTQASNSGTFHCEGNGYGRTYCGERGQHYEMVARSPSCQSNRTFGNDAYGTWISGACNADFRRQPYAIERGYAGDDDRYGGDRDYGQVYDNDVYDNDPVYTPGSYVTPMGSQQTIHCQSSGVGRTYCGDRERTYSLRVAGGSRCVLGQTYGRDSYGTWVAGNCNLTLVPEYQQYP